MILLLLFFALIYFSLQVAAVAKDPFGRVLAAGLAVYLAMHVLLNISMMCALLPIAGVPLIFVTYGGNSILRDIHLTVHEGERMVIVGRTGSGKTVLCNLAVRILESPKGCLFFDGIEIHHIPLDVLRRSIGYVPQDTILFSDTIRENIAFGRLDATDEEIEGAAHIAQIYDDIMGFPEGMNTVIGEKGITLSGGQRQRVAIARAILMNPPIFILDDALSSVDIQTEERILEGMGRFLRGKTSILITHRIAPLRRADRIVVLEEGRVAEIGDHTTLLSKGGIYTDLYWQRQLEEELERE
jgi:ATP-binding cassette subfamily B protein